MQQSNNHTSRTIRLTCKICGGVFEAVIVRKHPYFCSPECRALRTAAQNRRYAREGRYPQPLHLKTCEACGAPFQTPRPRTRCCSRVCGGKLTGPVLAARAKTRRQRPCAVCGEMFVPSNPSAAQRRAGYAQACCSRACAGRLRTRPNSAVAATVAKPGDLFDASD
jgi:hypothetical protein